MTSLDFDDTNDLYENSTYEKQNEKDHKVSKNQENLDNNFEVIPHLVSDFDFDLENSILKYFEGGISSFWRS